MDDGPVILELPEWRNQWPSPRPARPSLPQAPAVELLRLINAEMQRETVFDRIMAARSEARKPRSFHLGGRAV